MLADNSHHLILAAQARAESTHRRATIAIRELLDAGEPVTFQTVTAKAGVSRAWLYKTPAICEEIQRRRPVTAQPATPIPLQQRASDASLLTRLESRSSACGQRSPRTPTCSNNSSGRWARLAPRDNPNRYQRTDQRRRCGWLRS